MSPDPRREPSWRPEPRKKILGISIPPAPKISIPPSARNPSKGTKAGFAGGVSLALVLGIWQGLPAVLSALERPAEPSRAQPTMATQESVDAAHARITVLEVQVQRQGELLCALNGGSPGPGWPCDLQAYPAPLNQPPKYRTDRVYPTKERIKEIEP
jgi:hypothetical protein